MVMTQLRILSAADVLAALPMSRAIDVMREAFTLLARGEVEMPLRTAIPLPGQTGTFLVMSARAGKAFGTKLVTVLPNNPARGLPAVQSAVVMFDPDTGTPAALLDGGALTAIRTGAVSGLATDLLARRDASRVAIIGSGVQARTQLEAVCCVREIESVFVWSRTASHAAAFAGEMALRDGLPEKIAVASSVEAAVAGADIVCTATSSHAPLLLAEHIHAGLHINAIGSYTPEMRELDPTILGTARVVVDQREAALAEAGEVIAALREGLIDRDGLVELGDVVTGAAAGRKEPEQVTVFKSVGLAVQDVAAAAECDR